MQSTKINLIINSTIVKFVMLGILYLSYQSKSFAQDPIFTQFYNNMTLINPAFSGTTDNYLVSAQARMQQISIGVPYKTFSAGASRRFKSLGGGLGLNVLYDDAGSGVLKTSKIAIPYSYELKINNEIYVRGGLNFGMVSKALDWNKLIFGDQLDPINGGISPGGTPYPSQEVRPNSVSHILFDFGSGFLIHSPNFYLGISFDHLNRPNDGFLNNPGFKGVPLRWSIQAGYTIVLSRYNKKESASFISSNVLWVKQGDFAQLNIGGYIGLRQFIFGLAYRNAGTNPDAILASVGLRKGKIRWIYSFDYTISQLGINSGGSHELGFLINFDIGSRKKIDYSDCFSLFR
ncbi:MAG: PorP/SprF family type IX secretion system membrane protein [Lewinellaceae bacterium]|nr:PorP/SprF family type IX secretion system membrane protein [Lewinellaceae bacterium]